MTAGPLRVLYVDDDPALARLVQKGLERRGFAVETAAGGEAGLARLAAPGIDCVALDHYMPGRDGLETLAAIRALPDPPPVVYVTGTEETGVAVAALKAGASDYVLKTVGEAFVPLLAAALDQSMQGVRLRRARDEAEAELRAQRDRFEALAAERALLMREVNHRVGNSLQIIAALLHLQSSASPDEAVKTALADANRRVMAVAQVHRRLYTSDDVGAVALDQYLAALVADLAGAAQDGEAAAVTLAAVACEIDPDRAVAVGVIVTELVLNALKYAYPDGRGPIRVSVAPEAAGRLLLVVEDDGVGREAAVPLPHDRKGIGRMIVKAMATKLAAEWREDDAHRGMRVVFRFAGHPAPPPVA